MNLKTKLFDEAVEAFAQLPGIGRKTALRLVLHLLKMPADRVIHFSESISKLRRELQYCQRCYNISTGPLCEICMNDGRDASLLCVVEGIQDILSIENTLQYRGYYHVLGGLISPMEGVGPSQLQIESLVEKVSGGSIQEVICALSTTMEGDTTLFYLSKKLQSSGVKISTLSRGISIGGQLEFTDEITLGRSIQNRVPYETPVSR